MRIGVQPDLPDRARLVFEPVGRASGAGAFFAAGGGTVPVASAQRIQLACPIPEYGLARGPGLLNDPFFREV